MHLDLDTLKMIKCDACFPGSWLQQKRQPEQIPEECPWPRERHNQTGGWGLSWFFKCGKCNARCYARAHVIAWHWARDLQATDASGGLHTASRSRSSSPGKSRHSPWLKLLEPSRSRSHSPKSSSGARSQPKANAKKAGPEKGLSVFCCDVVCRVGQLGF